MGFDWNGGLGLGAFWRGLERTFDNRFLGELWRRFAGYLSLGLGDCGVGFWREVWSILAWGLGILAWGLGVFWREVSVYFGMDFGVGFEGNFVLGLGVFLVTSLGQFWREVWGHFVMGFGGILE